MNRILLVIAAAAGVECAPAMGAITYLTQDREIRLNAFVNGNFTGGTSAAPGFSEFNRSEMLTYSGGTGSGAASQLSRLLPTGVEFTGASSLVVSNFYIENMARSFLDITFVLDTPTPLEIVHSHSLGQSGNGQSGYFAIARLTREVFGSPTVFEWSEYSNQASNWPTSPTTQLVQPGTYRLYVEAFTSRTSSSVGNFGTTNASLSFSMTIPSPSAAVVLTVGMVRRSRRGRRSGSPRQRR